MNKALEKYIKAVEKARLELSGELMGTPVERSEETASLIAHINAEHHGHLLLSSLVTSQVLGRDCVMTVLSDWCKDVMKDTASQLNEW